jgi:hypothetical protein
MGLVTSSAGGSETRPAGPDAGLPGSLAARAADGTKARWRCHEARDRTEPESRGFGESRGRAPEGERVSQKGRAPRCTQTSGNACWRARGIYPCVFRRSASRLFEAKAFVQWLAELGREQKTRRENDAAYPHPRSGGGGPREARWRGRRTRRFALVVKNFAMSKSVRCAASLSRKEFRLVPRPLHHPSLAAFAADGPPPPLRG